MVSAAQTVFRALERELEGSSALGVESMATPVQAISFPSIYEARGGPLAGTFEIDANGNSLYRKYVLFYRDSATKEVLRTEVPIPPGHSTEHTPLQLSFQDFGSGPKALDSYAQNGRRVGTGVESLTAQRDGRVLSVSLRLSTEDGREQTYRSSTLLRN